MAIILSSRLKSQKPFRGTLLNKTHPLARRLVGAWIFNEKTGEFSFDHSGNGNHVNTFLASPTWEPDGIGCADATGSNVQVNPVGAFPTIGSGQYTVVIKFTNGQAQSSGLVDFDSYNPVWACDESGHIYIYDGGNKGDSTLTIPNGSTGTAAWVRRSTGAGDTYQYVNGVFSNAVTHSDSINKPSFIELGGDGANGDLTGVIHYVYIWDIALTPEEIAWLHREPCAMFYPDVQIFFGITEEAGGNAYTLSMLNSVMGQIPLQYING